MHESLPGLVETFAQTLSEHGIRATRLPFERNVESVKWVEEPLCKFLHMVSRNGKLARPVLKKHNVW